MAETHTWSTWPPAPRTDDRHARTRRVRWAERRPRVIVAHPSHHVRWFVASALRLDDHRVACVRSGAELTARLAHWTLGGGRADLVVCGPHLHGVTAGELIRGLAGSEWQTPILGVIGPHDARFADELSGADATFAWPFDADDLRTAALHLVSMESAA